ncbi:MAG: TIGR02449 family protein [Gammaproteobacteria bacterium]|nr:TIGR02449 family protein [Gammaproteobacteria bacterium]
MSDDSIEKLEKRILDLIRICEKISKDNDLLKSDQKKLREDFLEQREKNKMAREKIEAILARLESTES